MRGRATIALALALLTLGVFAQTVRFAFVDFDDRSYVYENPHVLAGLTAPGLRWAFTTNETANWHPLTWLSLMLDAELYGARAGGFHATNVLLHVANVLLLFVALERSTGARGRSAFVAALFAIHPLHVEPVAWVSSRKDVLSTFFGLLALLAWRAAVARPTPRARWPWQLATAALFACSLMAKQMLMTFPLLLLLFDVWPLARLGQGARRLLFEKLPLAALALAAAGAALAAQASAGALAMTRMLTAGERLANALVASALYLGRTLWPRHLACYYPHPRGSIAPGAIAAAVALLVAITALAFLARRARPYLLVGWLWFAVSLVPVIGLIQLGSARMADRYSYVPLVGLFVAITWLAAELGPVATPHRRRVLAACGAIVLAALALAAAHQTASWRDTRTVFDHAIAAGHPSYTAHYNLGSLLGRTGEVDAAIAHLEAAIALEPEAADAYTNLGNCFLVKGDLARALEFLTEAATLDPRQVSARMSLGITLERLGRDAEAIASFEAARAIEPGNQAIQATLATARERVARAGGGP